MPGSRRRPPRALAKVLRANEYGVIERARRYRDAVKPFREAWQTAAPQACTEHSSPVLYEDGLLTVWVDSPVWASTIRHAQQTIISRLRVLELPPVVSIQIRLAPGFMMSSRYGSSGIMHSDGRLAADKYRNKPADEALQLLESTARSIHDSDLRASLLRLKKTLEKPDS